METTRIVRESAVGRKEGRRKGGREGETERERGREDRRKRGREKGGRTILQNYLIILKLICNSRNV